MHALLSGITDQALHDGLWVCFVVPPVPADVTSEWDSFSLSLEASGRFMDVWAVIEVMRYPRGRGLR